uniref:Uncharacterized protein n=1 Tax=Picea glauca TaxID=3330 RepID=A0A101LUH4_PICGL|nr:hypothetical protein ABT39_MTgene2415 [Picea glauca]QHR86766.1 hypothetical protein Q903MT_gene770 [Picea sitchensis]
MPSTLVMKSGTSDSPQVCPVRCHSKYTFRVYIKVHPKVLAFRGNVKLHYNVRLFLRFFFTRHNHNLSFTLPLLRLSSDVMVKPFSDR